MDYVNLSDPQVRRIAVEVRYPTAPGFFKNQGELIAASDSESVVVSLSENKIEVDDRANACRKHVDFLRCAIVSEEFDTPEGFLADVADHWLHRVLNVLGVAGLRRIGVRQMIVYPSESTFEQVRDECQGLMFAIGKDSWGSIGGEPSDVGFAFDFELGNRGAHLAGGPMKQEQMKAFFSQAQDLPEVGFFVDWDFYTRGDVSIRDLTEFMRQAAGHEKRKIRQFLNSLGGEQANG
jgi:hypothetical protein